MNRSLVATLIGAASMIALGPMAAAHGGEFTAEGLTEALDRLRITMTREPDTDPNASAPAGFFPAIFDITLTDAQTGAIVEQELDVLGFDNFDGHGTTTPWNYQFSSRGELGIHLHGGGDAVRANVFSFSGHFEGTAAIHHSFNAVAVVA